jgi:protoheme IX farnesyltransferase
VTVRSTTVPRESRVRTPAQARPWDGVLDHLVLLKPRVMSLVVFTGGVGFALAPAPMDWMKLLATLSAMAGGAGACGALNMWWDADIDANMARTAMRPIPRGVVPPLEALAIGILLSIVSVAALAIKVNVLAATLLALTIAIYVPLYTMVLKRSTPMNIVIGGAAGALPPVIGWAAAMDSVSAGPIAMFLITFLWTPPHFWALALCRSGDYERVGVPMLPNVVRQTRGSSGGRSPCTGCAMARNRRAARRRWPCSASQFSTCSSCSQRCSPRSCCGDAFKLGGSRLAVFRI